MNNEEHLNKRILVNNETKENIQIEVEKVIQESGGNNYLYCSYLKEISKLIYSSEDNKYNKFKANINIKDSPAWDQSFKLVIAFLKRYKMNYSLKTIQDEGINIPKSTGFTKASEVEKYFKELFIISNNLENKSFEERLEKIIPINEIEKILF